MTHSQEKARDACKGCLQWREACLFVCDHDLLLPCVLGEARMSACSAGLFAMVGTMLAVAQKQQTWVWVLTEFKVRIWCNLPPQSTVIDYLTVRKKPFGVSNPTYQCSSKQSSMLPCENSLFTAVTPVCNLNSTT